MSLFKEIPPTAGFPLSIQDFLKPYIPESLECDFRRYCGLAYARVTYSGTAAFYLILESLKKISSRKTVIIPSFVCPLVALAIARAGLKVEVCDIRQDSFDYDYVLLERLCAASQDILAVVAVHLGGIAVDFAALEKTVRKYGVFIIEDCAQSLGAEYAGRKTGALGDFSFYSFCRGKGLTIYEGGIIGASREEYAGIIEEIFTTLVRDDYLSEALKILELLGYWIFYRPSLFWFVYGLPQLFWNLSGNNLRGVNEYFDTNFPMHKVSFFRKSVGHSQFGRLEQEIEKQREKAAFYIRSLSGLNSIEVIRDAQNTISNYPYLTLILDDISRRNNVLRSLKAAEVGVSQIYASAITDYDYLKGIVPERDCPAGRYIAARHLTLSTSVFLSKDDLARAVTIIKK
ncbi:MAG: DegT/DnrJ/EryC1/StrS aminotransferase family protein [Candidatus Omnitrophota bacterium]